MSFTSFVHSLQNKPEATRWRILYTSLLSIMFLVVVFWVAHLRLTFADRERATTTSTSVSPFTDVRLFLLETQASFKEGWKAFTK